MRSAEHKLIKLYRHILSTSIPRISRGDPCLFFTYLKDNIERSSNTRCTLSNILQMKTVGIPFHLKWYKISIPSLSLQHRQLYQHFIETCKYKIPEKYDLELVLDSSKTFEIGHLVQSFSKRLVLYPGVIPDYPLPDPPKSTQSKATISQTLESLRLQRQNQQNQSANEDERNPTSTSTISKGGDSLQRRPLLTLSERTREHIQQRKKSRFPGLKSIKQPKSKTYSQKELESLAQKLGISPHLVQNTWKVQQKNDAQKVASQKVREELVIPKNLSTPESDPIIPYIDRLKGVANMLRSHFSKSKTTKQSRLKLIDLFSSPTLSKDDLDTIFTILSKQLPHWIILHNDNPDSKNLDMVSMSLNKDPDAWKLAVKQLAQLKKKYSNSNQLN